MPGEPSQRDAAFEIGFYEAVLKRAPVFAEVIEILGGLYTKAGRIADGLRMDRRLVRLQPDNPVARYNLACSLALSARRSPAMKALKQAIELGYKDFDWMSKDPDLESLRKHQGFVALIEGLKQKG